jgi:hypothetical protein
MPESGNRAFLPAFPESAAVRVPNSHAPNTVPLDRVAGVPDFWPAGLQGASDELVLTGIVKYDNITVEDGQ